MFEREYITREEAEKFLPSGNKESNNQDELHFHYINPDPSKMTPAVLEKYNEAIRSSLKNK